MVLSNHGGRQLDTARSGIEILEDVVQALDRHVGRDRWRGHFELYVDGGIRRATDIFKAVAMGATAVGIGRPVLYSLASYVVFEIFSFISLKYNEYHFRVSSNITNYLTRASRSNTGVKETLDRRFSQFRGHEQQDAHEYLQCILNTLHNDLRSGEKESIKDGDVLSPLQFWISHTTRNRSVVQDQFEGLTTSLTTCPKCSFTRRTFPRSGLYVFEYTFFTHTQVRTNRS